MLDFSSMFSTSRHICLQAAALLLLIPTVSLQADEEKETPPEPAAVLTIGSKAPDLDVEHWVSNGEGKFSKVTSFDKDKVYVVEFWATWCGPCIASMPHIVETQKNYQDKGVQVVSISNEDLETVEKFLERKVPNSEAEQTFAELTKSYCLTTDPDGSSSKDYMRAAGRNGIPCAFIVGKTGLVEWIGHPMSMDEALASVVNNSWDREAFAIKFKQEQEFDIALREISKLANARKFDEAIEALLNINVKDNQELTEQKDNIHLSLLVAAKKFDEALTKVDSLIEKEKEDPSRLLTTKARILLNTEDKAAQGVALIKTLCEDEKQSDLLKINLVSQLSSAILNGTLKDESYFTSTKELAESLLKKINGESSLNLLINLSALCAHQNDKPNAIAYLEKALAVNTNPRIKTILENRLKILQAPEEPAPEEKKEEPKSESTPKKVEP